MTSGLLAFQIAIRYPEPSGPSMPLLALARALLTGKPYFGPALRAMQGVPERHQYFLPLVASLIAGPTPREIKILEIGSWAGASTISWAEAITNAGATGKVTCIDPWLPYFDTVTDANGHYSQMNDAARDDVIVYLFHHNIRAAGIADRVEVMRGESRSVLPGLQPRQFDIVYIDGSHRFEDVRFDISEAKRLLRTDGIICGDDLEVEASSVDSAELRENVARGQDYVASSSGEYYHPGVTAAVAEAFDGVGVWEGFWAVKASGGRWVVPDLDVSDLRLPDHIARRHGIAHFLESTPEYNLVEADGRYYGIAKSLGQVDLFQERLGERELPPAILEAGSFEEIRAKCTESRRVGDPPPGPVLIDSYRGFNLVTCGSRTIAARQSLGPVDLAGDESELQGRLGSENFTAASSTEIVKLQVDRIELGRELQFATSALSSLRAQSKAAVEGLAREVAELRAAMTSETEARGVEMAGLRAAMTSETETRSREIAALASSVEAVTAAQNRQWSELHDNVAKQAQERIRELAEFRRDLDCALTRSEDETRSMREALEQRVETYHSKLERLADELPGGDQVTRDELGSMDARMNALSRQHGSLESEVYLMRFGPGQADTPCSAGSHRGFEMVYYRGRVYGIRQPADPLELSAGEPDLMMRYGPDNLIVGESLDGVRARIDVLETLRDMRAELASFDKDLRQGALHLDGCLHQIDEAIKTQDRKLQELSRAWPNRLRTMFSH